MLKISNLETGYGESQVLFDISLNVKKGDIVSLVGSNAAGKTTLLNTISGLNKVWKGKIEFLGQDVTSLSPEDRVELGLIQSPEGRRLFPELTVEDNILLGSYSKRAKSKRSQNLKMVYDKFPKLYERRKQLAGLLSGGEQQMVAIGRSLMSCPELLILDEPSLGLAPIIVSDVFKIIEEISEAGVTVFLVEQNVKKALSIAKSGYVLESGRIAMKGDAKELLDNEDLRKAYLGI